MANIMDLYSQPIPVNSFSDEIARQVQSLRQYQMQQQAQIQPFQQMLMKAKMEQMSPIYQFEQKKKLADYAKTLYEMGAPIPEELKGMFFAQPTPMTGQPQGMPASNLQLPPQPNIQSPASTTGGIRQPEKFVTEKATTEMTPYGPRVKSTSMVNLPGTSQIEATKKKAEFTADIGKSNVTNKYNLSLVAETAFDLSDWLAKAHKKGAAGDIAQKGLAWGASKGLFVGPAKPFAKKYAEAGAVPGKRTEFIMKMFPMLTQQLGKEGSIRLIESIFSRIGQTLPDLETPIDMAPNMMAGTIQSLYRIQRALENIDLSKVDFENPSDYNNFIDSVITETANIQLQPDEQQVLENLINTAIQPLTDLTQEPFSFGRPKQFAPKQQTQQPQADVRTKYNQLRASGVSAEEAKRQLGL